MGKSVNVLLKDIAWSWIMDEHRAGRRPTIRTAEQALGYSHHTCQRLFKTFAHFGYLAQNHRREYHVARAAEVLDDTTRRVCIEPKDDRYVIPAEREPSPRRKHRKPKESPVTGTWRRTLGGVVTDAHHRRLPRKEFHYRVIACAICGDATIDSMQHHCIGGWRIEADRCICPKCARRET